MPTPFLTPGEVDGSEGPGFGPLAVPLALFLLLLVIVAFFIARPLLVPPAQWPRRRRRARAFVAVLLVSLSACRGAPRDPGLYVGDTPPPERFRGDTGAVVWFLSPAEVDLRCGDITGRQLGDTFYACTHGVDITLPNPCGAQFAGERFARLACHELGHENLWPATHGP